MRRRTMAVPYDWLDGYLLSKPGAEHDHKIEWQ